MSSVEGEGKIREKRKFMLERGRWWGRGKRRGGEGRGAYLSNRSFVGDGVRSSRVFVAGEQGAGNQGRAEGGYDGVVGVEGCEEG